MINNIDYDRLRKDLIDYFGTATNYHPLAIFEIIRIENASNNELINIAINNCFDISNYEMFVKSNKLNRDLY